jgi:hypothetical protein
VAYFGCTKTVPVFDPQWSILKAAVASIEIGDMIGSIIALSGPSPIWVTGAVLP